MSPACLDTLRRRRVQVRVETALTSELAESGVENIDDIELAEQVGGAVQIVLDAVTPAERVAFVLHDLFGYSFDEVGDALGRSNTAVRQLASRARRKIQGLEESDAEQKAAAEHRRVGEAFPCCCPVGRSDTTLVAARSGRCDEGRWSRPSDGHQPSL
ncbi:MAG: sigma factor-like helix-turn-helix DNA-binding protein [Acidimicrobiales bacterium]